MGIQYILKNQKGTEKMEQKKNNINRAKAIAVSAVLLASCTAANLMTAAAADSKTEQKAAPISEVVNDSGLKYDYARALQYSMYFYDANMCGTGVKENNLLPWRGNCHTYDAEVPLDSEHTNLSDAFIKKYKDVLDPDGNGTVDVSGGFHDAGDHVKFGLPEAYAASVVSWGYYEFRDAYKKTVRTSTLKQYAGTSAITL